MKKINIILAAAAVAFALASCDKALVETEMAQEPVHISEGIKLNITVGDFGSDSNSGVATKAVKKSWADGDQINIWYDGNIQQTPDLVIKYNSTTEKWETDASAGVSGNAPSASGKLTAMYVEGGMSAFASYGEQSTLAVFGFTQSSTQYDGTNYPNSVSLVTYVENAAYTYESETLTVTLEGWSFKNNSNVQVVITGSGLYNYALSCDKFVPKQAFVLHKDGTVGEAATNYGHYVLPVSNTDGYAYMFNFSGNDTDFTFTLSNADGTDKRTYTVSGKTLDNTGNVLNAIKIPFSKFSSKSASYVEIGGVKWATMNVGATTIADSPATCYGDYFAWGEVKPYATGVPYTTTVTAYITEWSSETVWGGTTGTKNGYNLKNYCGSNSFTEWSPAPYDATSKVLTSTYDAAAANWGPAWRMPTSSEFSALFKACSGSTWASGSYTTITEGTSITSGGVYFLSTAGLAVDGVTYGAIGMLFVDATDVSLRVFFPSAGRCTDNMFYANKACADYWSSTKNSSGNDSAYRMYWNTDGIIYIAMANSRCYGAPIRPVVAE